MNEKIMRKTMIELKKTLDRLSTEDYELQTTDYLLITYLYDIHNMGEEISLIDMFKKFTESLLTIFLTCIKDEVYEVIPSIKSAQLSQMKYLWTLYQNNEEALEELEIQQKVFEKTMEEIIKIYTS